jgi:hypothetical protein
MLNAIIFAYLSGSLDSCVYEALVSAGRSKQFSARESLEKIDPNPTRTAIRKYARNVLYIMCSLRKGLEQTDRVEEIQSELCVLLCYDM